MNEKYIIIELISTVETTLIVPNLVVHKASTQNTYSISQTFKVFLHTPQNAW